MKEINLTAPQPSQRLIDLIEKIPELIISKGKVVSTDSGRVYIYDLENNSIHHYANNKKHEFYNINPLLNKKLLYETIRNGDFFILQEQFCDVLEQHLYLKAKQKMEELLPQICEWYPYACVCERDGENFLNIFSSGERTDIHDTIVSYNNYELSAPRNTHFNYIWEDKDNLIVKKNNPMPEIKRGYAINEKGNCVICADDKFEEYTTIEDSSVIDTFVDEEIKIIYDENDELIWEKNIME